MIIPAENKKTCDAAQRFLFLGAVFAFFAVVLGAFAAHGLKDMLSSKHFDIFLVGTRYHMYHSLGLFVVGFSLRDSDTQSIRMAGGCFCAGILLFSGSLYLLAITGITKLGIITPFGGAAFLLGWGLLAYSACSKRSKP